jgi:carbon storage regulator
VLWLRRKKGESIVVGDEIEVVVLSLDGDTAKIGIQAPQNLRIERGEVWLAARAESCSVLEKAKGMTDELKK